MAAINKNGRTVKDKTPGNSAKSAKNGLENIIGMVQANMDPKAGQNLSTIMKIAGLLY